MPYQHPFAVFNLCVFSFQLFQCPAQLVWATRGFVTAAYAVEQAYHLVWCLTDNEFCHPLCIARTTTMEEAMGDTPLLVRLHVDELAARALRLIKSLGHPYSSGFMLV